MRNARPSTFTFHGREWDLLPGVFAPTCSPSTGISLAFLGLTNSLPGRHPAGSFLEIGTGTGVVAVSAAVAGYGPVTATDISAAATRNTAINAARHDVAERVRIVQSDLFEKLPAGERFDTVFWHSNFVLAPADYEYQDMHERAYVDAGYIAHRRFLQEVPNWGTPGGTALLHFSSRGDLALLHQIAHEYGRSLELVHEVHIQDHQDAVDHLLFEVH